MTAGDHILADRDNGKPGGRCLRRLDGSGRFSSPITYTSLLGLGTTEGLALSFGAFILSGVLGSVNYKKPETWM